MTTKGERKGMGWLAGSLLVLVLAGAGWLGWVWLDEPPVEGILAGNVERLVEDVQAVDDWAEVTPEETESIWRGKRYVLDDSRRWTAELESRRQLFYASAGGEALLLVAFFLVWLRRRPSPRAFLAVVGVFMLGTGAALALALASPPGVPGHVDRQMEGVQLPAPTDGPAGARLHEVAPRLRDALRVLPSLYRKQAAIQGKVPVYATAALEGVLALFLLWGFIRARRRPALEAMPLSDQTAGSA